MTLGAGKVLGLLVLLALAAAASPAQAATVNLLTLYDQRGIDNRITAFTADTITAAKISQLRVLPIRKLIASMTRLTPRSAPTLLVPSGRQPRALPPLLN